MCFPGVDVYACFWQRTQPVLMDVHHSWQRHEDPNKKNLVKDWDTALMERAHSLMDPVQVSPISHLPYGEKEARK